MGYIAGPPQSNPTNEPNAGVAQDFNAVSSADIPIKTNSVNKGVSYSPTGTKCVGFYSVPKEL